MKRPTQFGIASNNIDLAIGSLMNWEVQYEFPNKEGRMFLIINVGSLYNLKQCTYDVDNSKLLINQVQSDAQSMPFFCETIDDAETIVFALHMGMGVDIMPLYKKK